MLGDPAPTTRALRGPSRGSGVALPGLMCDGAVCFAESQGGAELTWLWSGEASSGR